MTVPDSYPGRDSFSGRDGRDGRDSRDSYPGRNAEIYDLGTHWRQLVQNWVARRNYHTVHDTVSVSLQFDLREAGRVVTLRFMTTKRLLVAFATDGNFLRQDQLAIAAAASNAWNTEQLNPMLSVWDVRGPRPCLAGVCDLPLTCRITQADFDALANDWVERARQMFSRCHQVFKL
ncbi:MULTISPECIES: hypothetical protein [Streptomyces]|uniref:Uncharacterized protein n=1 Tax=Streptomyces caniscabiei TaxID=2746961 RepID=A0ABU4MNH1_9ACTN|nr:MULTISPECIES: hypothetical protein [Streptomyces]MBE4738993.1 hypothetical protein [Streptomyces caniscabiei]MBE4757867.1 hypothetical protein [Streptomyces caniscabiei]MBE4772280.1 hypothetical protein [Streptomyces caniscabiei]MBE4787528.1 hypothetical protein [Streptomyces caniscabiei]MBE4794243.1 hypothetical protein [Streptomyces caniscabiei]